MSFLLASAWGLAILAGMAGWGRALWAILRGERAGWAESAALGLAALIFAGGWLNLGWLISSHVLIGLVLGGVLLCVIDLARHRSGGAASERRLLPKDGWSRALMAAAILAVSLRYLAAVVCPRAQFNAHDDLQGYFVFPVKMLQTGSMGPDAYSERRLVSSLGGGYIPDAIVISALDFANLDLADAGLGIVLLAGLLAALFRRLEVSPRSTYVALLVLALVPPLQGNITSLLLPAALFLALYLLMARIKPETGTAGDAALLAFLGGAICTMKSSLIPACGLLLALYCVAWPLSKRRVVWSLSVAAGIAVFVLPWSLSLHASSGTYLYPLLGKGFDVTAYGIVKPHGGALAASSMLKVIAISAVPLLAWVALRRVGAGGAGLSMVRGLPITPILLSAAVGAAVIGYGTGGFGFARYPFPYLLTSAIVVLGLLARWSQIADSARVRRMVSWSLSVAVVLLLAAGVLYGRRTRLPAHWRERAGFALRADPLVSPAEVARLRGMQEAVPRGEPILARLSLPFALDFRRNPVWIADYPGSASPPPGMPFGQGPERLAGYLRERGVRYVAYSYRDEAKFTRAQFGGRLEPGAHHWLRSEAMLTFDFQENLAKLADSRRRLFDDGEEYVLDLAQSGERAGGRKGAP